MLILPSANPKSSQFSSNEIETYEQSSSNDTYEDFVKKAFEGQELQKKINTLQSQINTRNERINERNKRLESLDQEIDQTTEMQKSLEQAGVQADEALNKANTMLQRIAALKAKSMPAK